MYITNSSRYSFKPFILRINTNLGTDASFTLPLVSGVYVYDFAVDWGDGTSDHITSFSDVAKSHTYSTHGEYYVTIKGQLPAWSFNNAGDKLKVVEIVDFGYTRFAYLYGAFYGCTNLTSAISTHSNTLSSVTNMGYMFTNCSSLTTLDVSNWDVGSVTAMNSMFRSCSQLTTLDVSNWDVGSVTNMGYMFTNCSSLTTLDVSNWDVGSVTNMLQMFYGCSQLTTLDVSGWDVGSVTTMNSMFRSCSQLTTLDVSNWDTQLLTSFREIIDGCTNLTLFDMSNWIFNYSNAVSCVAAFRNCGVIDLRFGIGHNFATIPTGENNSLLMQGSNIGTSNYDYLLSLIDSQAVNDNIIFGVGTTKYSAVGKIHRDNIIANHNWTITDGGMV